MDLCPDKSAIKPSSITELWQIEPSYKLKTLRALGRSLRRIPMSLWEENMFFTGAKDRALKEKTLQFPKRLKGSGSTHPIFVLKGLGNFGYQVCPCTSKYQMGRYIKAMCVLSITKEIVEVDSFLLEQFAFSLGHGDQMIKRLRFKGIVPEECICNPTTSHQ